MKKKVHVIRRLLTFCLMLFLAVGIGSDSYTVFAANADTGSNSGVQEVRKNVVVVSTWLEFEDGEDIEWGNGTGFFVSGPEGGMVQYLVTNHHVIEYFLEHGAGEWVNVKLPMANGSYKKYYLKAKIRVYYNSKDYEEAYMVDYDETKDLAILKLDNPTDKRGALALRKPTDAMVGQPIYVVGFPGLAENRAVDAVSRWEVSDASITNGVVGRLFTTAGTGVRRIQTNAVMQKGNSGSPMVNADGSVLGVCNGYYPDSDEIDYYAINVDELIPMLNRNGVDYELKGDGQTDSDENGNSVNGENGNSGNDVNGDSVNGENGNSVNGENGNGGNDVNGDSVNGGNKDVIKEDTSGNTMLIAAVIVIAILVIILIVLVITRKKPQAAASPQGGTPYGQPQAAAGPVAYSMAAQHNGARFALSGKQILIGRDIATCTIVFREDTPGVSNRHCSLGYDNTTGDFILTDLRSTYGTFLVNGQQLTPGVPYRLKAGGEFYLGENSNLIRVVLE